MPTNERVPRWLLIPAVLVWVMIVIVFIYMLTEPNRAAPPVGDAASIQQHLLLMGGTPEGELETEEAGE